jgi:hypothetical protein
MLIFTDSITLLIRPEPESVGGGKVVEQPAVRYTLDALFIPDASRMFIPTKDGDMLVSTSEVQISDEQLIANSITDIPTYNTKVLYGGRSYTVIRVEDYRPQTGAILLKVVAELDVVAH